MRPPFGKFSELNHSEPPEAKYPIAKTVDKKRLLQSQNAMVREITSFKQSNAKLNECKFNRNKKVCNSKSDDFKQCEPGTKKDGKNPCLSVFSKSNTLANELILPAAVISSSAGTLFLRAGFIHGQ